MPLQLPDLLWALPLPPAPGGPQTPISQTTTKRPSLPCLLEFMTPARREWGELSPPPALQPPLPPCLRLPCSADDAESTFRMERNLYQDVGLRYCLCERALRRVLGVRGPVGGPLSGEGRAQTTPFLSLNATSAFLLQSPPACGQLWLEPLCPCRWQALPLGPRSDVPSSQKPVWASSLPDIMSRQPHGPGWAWGQGCGS